MYPALDEQRALEERTEQPLKITPEKEKEAQDTLVNRPYGLRPRNPLHGRVEYPSPTEARHSVSYADGIRTDSTPSPDQRSRSVGRKARASREDFIHDVARSKIETSHDAGSPGRSAARTGRSQRSPTITATHHISPIRKGHSPQVSPVRVSRSHVTPSSHPNSPHSSPVRTQHPHGSSARNQSPHMSSRRAGSSHSSPERTTGTNSSPSHSPSRVSTQEHSIRHRENAEQKSPITSGHEELKPPVKRGRPMSARAGRRTPPQGYPDGGNQPPVQDPVEQIVRSNDWSTLNTIVCLFSHCCQCACEWTCEATSFCRQWAEERRSNAVDKRIGKSNERIAKWKFLSIVLLFVFGISLYMFRGSSTASLPRVVVHQEAIPEEAKAWAETVAGLAKRHPSQRESLWRALRASLNRSYMKNEQPAVVVLAASETQKAEIECLTRHLARAVRSVDTSVSYLVPEQVVISIDGDEVSRLSVAEAKQRVNNQLDKLRGRGEYDRQTDVIIVRDLQQLQPLTAMLLHGFTDNEHAPRKRALFLLCVTTPSRPASADQRVTADVEQQLLDRWGETLGDEIFDALLGRIAGYVVAVESDPTLRNC